MGELDIRRITGSAVPQYPSVSKAEKTAGGTEPQKAAGQPGCTVSDTLRQLMSGTAADQARDSRRVLQTGETVLAEVQERLGRMKELAQQAADGSGSDRAALQAELEKLRADIDRMIRGASAGGTPLFLDGDPGMDEGMDELLDAVRNEASSSEEAGQALPDWLIKGLAQGAPSAERLLASLGLDKTAGGAELLAAVAGRSLERDPAAGYLATLYLGAVLAGGDPSEGVDPQQAMEGIQRLLEKLDAGVPLDQAIEELTGGEFTSLADFQLQFTSGTAPGLQDFLVHLLLSDSESLLTADTPLLALLAGFGGGGFDLLMSLMSVPQSLETGPEPALAPDPQTTDSQTADPQAAVAPGAAETPGPQTSVVQYGNVQVLGRDLSGVSYDEASGTLTVGGTADVVIQGTERGARGNQVILLTGSGTATLQDVTGSALVVDSAAARLLSAGQNELAEVSLRQDASLTFSGGGLLKIGVLHANESNTLRLAGGAVLVEEERSGAASRAITASVLLDGAASLAARAAHVTSFDGKPLEAFDLVWKALLPGWSGITSLTVDGQPAKMNLKGGDTPDPARLWLDKGDPTHGFSLHSLIFRGRDRAGQLQTRYAYLRWSQSMKRFQTLSMYPNPFTITGGEEGQDWHYEEETHTLRILTAQVTAISGGRGRNADQTPFSGRVALADHIGTMALALAGVVCRVSSGPALDLGRANNVTLILQSGSSNRFESGAGCAGISLGDGTTLSVDRAKAQDDRTPVGALTATGTGGGAGIGRDKGAGRDESSHILIRGGTITATGAGGGAGIGAGKHSGIGPIIITGGSISAEAGYHAAAIGAGVHGSCGDILISGTARIVKAAGGDPGADIGACLFGTCGEVQIAGGADIGSARLRRKTGLSLQMGDDTVTLPQFRLSSRTLRLDNLQVTTREYARSAKITIDADQRMVAQVQEAYSALYGRLEESFSGLYSFRQYVHVPEEPLRDNAAANALLQESILLQPAQAVRTHSRRGSEDVQQLLR